MAGIFLETFLNLLQPTVTNLCSVQVHKRSDLTNRTFNRSWRCSWTKHNQGAQNKHSAMTEKDTYSHETQPRPNHMLTKLLSDYENHLEKIRSNSENKMCLCGRSSHGHTMQTCSLFGNRCTLRCDIIFLVVCRVPCATSSDSSFDWHFTDLVSRKGNAIDRVRLSVCLFPLYLLNRLIFELEF